MPDLSLPPKPSFSGKDSLFGNSENKDSAATPASAAKKDDSPSSLAGDVVNGNTVTEKKDDSDFAKPVTPVSEANGGHELPLPSTASVAPLPLTEEEPAEKPGPSEPTAASIPTATAPSVAPVTSTAPATNGSSSSDAPASSLAAGLPAKPVEPVKSAVPAEPAAPATEPVVGEKRKADEATEDKPVAETAAAVKPLPASVESVTDVEDAASAPKKQKTDANADAGAAAAAVDVAPKSTPAEPPVEVPAPSPVTVAAPAADPIAAPVGAPASVAPALEVNLDPAPSAEEIDSTSTDAPASADSSSAGAGAGVKKSNSRAKREKKPLPPVGKTARKTRSQGPAA